MNLKIALSHVRKLGAFNPKLRAVVVIQGILWIIAGFSLLTIAR